MKRLNNYFQTSDIDRYVMTHDADTGMYSSVSYRSPAGIFIASPLDPLCIFIFCHMCHCLYNENAIFLQSFCCCWNLLFD